MGSSGIQSDDSVLQECKRDGFRRALPSFFSGLGISEDDSIQVSYSGGVAECVIRTSDGRVITQRVVTVTQGSLAEFKDLDTKAMDREEKRKLARTLRDCGHLTQTEIARQLGVSQATISNYLKS